MAQFKYNALFTFKAKELIEAMEKQEAKMTADIEASEQRIRDQGEDLEEKYAEVRRLTRELGLDTPGLRRQLLDKQTRDTLKRAERGTVRRALRALRTQEPHRQYKLDLEDIRYFGLLMEDEDDD